MNIKLTTFFVIFISFAITGCNTIKGAGKDLEAGGRGIEKAADRNRPATSPK